MKMVGCKKNDMKLLEMNNGDFTNYKSVDLKSYFDYLNKELFDKELPDITIKWTRATKRAGEFKYKISRIKKLRQTIDKVLYDPKYPPLIGLSSRIIDSESKLLNVLAHEMIHYYIWYKRIEDDDHHGTYFKKYMNIVNNKGIVNVSLTYNGSFADIKMKTPVYIAIIESEMRGKDRVITFSNTYYKNNSYNIADHIYDYFKRMLKIHKVTVYGIYSTKIKALKINRKLGSYYLKKDVQDILDDVLNDSSTIFVDDL